MRQRTIILAVAVAAMATTLVSNVAFADTLTITFGQGSYNQTTKTLSGQQTSVWSDGKTSSTYYGTYSGTGTLDAQYCIVGNKNAVLDFPAAQNAKVHSGITLVLGSPLCLINFKTDTFTILDTSGFGAFNGAFGGGLATYNAPTTMVFDDTSGKFNLPLGGGIGATPELDSILLFGAGALGLAGYALARARAQRKSRATSG